MRDSQDRKTISPAVRYTDRGAKRDRLLIGRRGESRAYGNQGFKNNRCHPQWPHDQTNQTVCSPWFSLPAICILSLRFCEIIFCNNVYSDLYFNAQIYFEGEIFSRQFSKTRFGFKEILNLYKNVSSKHKHFIFRRNFVVFPKNFF